MKKMLAALLAALLLIPCAASAAGTARVGLVEFIEHYMERITECQRDMELDFGLPLQVISDPPNAGESYVILQSSAGVITINSGGFTVEDLSMVFLDFSEGSTDDYSLLNCAASVSVLEYCDSMHEGVRIVREDISPRFEDALKQSMESGNGVMVYSGNYIYSILYREYDGNMVIFLDARERKYR